MTNPHHMIFNYDRPALLRAVARRGLDLDTLAGVAQISRSTMRRLCGEQTPKGMTPERALKVNGKTVIKLAAALKCKPQEFCPSFPARPPDKRPPDTSLVDKAPRMPGGWRHPSQKAAVRQRRWQLAAPGEDDES